MTPSISSMSPEAFTVAARITVAFCLLYAGTLVYQGMLKIRLRVAAAKKKEAFERYGSLQMLAADRAVGNLLEWSVPFLALLWLSMALTDGATGWMGWGYVACRALYPFAAINGGIGTSGPKAFMLLSTMPGYLFLLGLLGTVLMRLV